MIRVEHVEVFNFEGAIRGLRNPMNSWNKSDSYVCDEKHCGSCKQNPKTRDCSQPDGFIVGKNDLALMKKLYKAGTEHRKYLRQIFVSMDIVAPLYWWKEMDTYKVGTVANSCSTMHKIAAKEFELDDFSHEHILDTHLIFDIIEELNHYRRLYLETKEKEYWWKMIQLLPSSYNQRRTITMTYENVVSMIKQRDHHKLDEWNILSDIFKQLPYIEEIME